MLAAIRRFFAGGNWVSVAFVRDGEFGGCVGDIASWGVVRVPAAAMYLLPARSDRGELGFGKLWVPIRLISLILFACIAIAWVGLAQLPAFSATVTNYWNPDSTFYDAILQALSIG